MQTVTIIADCFFRPSDNSLAPTSVLALPLGCGSVLDHLCESAAQIGSRDIWIVRDESMSTVSVPNSHCGWRIRTLLKSKLSLELRSLEPSDLLLFIDPRHWPAEGFSLAHLKQHLAGHPGAVHSVAMGADPTGAIESVQLDDVGRVRRIRRLYEGVTQTVRHRGIVTHSIMPMAAMDGIDFVSCSKLPVSLAHAGVVSRDVIFRTRTLDLTIPGEYLALCNSILDAAIRGPLQNDYSRLDKRILLGRGTHVHETARLSGSIIIQKGCTIQEGAVIIGPALIGANSRVGRNAIVAQSVVPMHGAVEDLTSIRHAALGAIPQTINSNNPDINTSEQMRWDRNSLAGAEPHNVLPDIHTAGLFKSSIKRGADIALALIALIIAMPVMIVAAILIKLDSRGPLFFVHHREGRFGRSFPCLKFRTMAIDAHERQRELSTQNQLDGPHFKITNDPRVTRIGHFLRKYNIDELPQLFNVLAGHMSVVGPRPSPFRENQFCIPWRRARLSVRPGVTGLWQICRSDRNDGDFQQWIYYDMMYVRRMSTWLDLNVLIATLFALTTGREIPIHWLIKPEHRPLSEDAVAQSFLSLSTPGQVGQTSHTSAHCMPGNPIEVA